MYVSRNIILILLSFLDLFTNDMIFTILNYTSGENLGFTFFGCFGSLASRTNISSLQFSFLWLFNTFPPLGQRRNCKHNFLC